MKHKLVMVLLMMGMCTTLFAQGYNTEKNKKTYPKITPDDLKMCHNEIGKFHTMEIAYLKKDARQYCNKGQSYDAENCKAANKWVGDSSKMRDMDWFIKGNESCSASDYPCFGLSLYNDNNPNEDIIRRQATNQPEWKEGGEFWDYSFVVDHCIAKIWVTKLDGKAPVVHTPSKAGVKVHTGTIWRTITTDNGCEVYMNFEPPDGYKSITWSGKCQDGKGISGKGELSFWYEGDKKRYWQANFVDGYMDGKATQFHESNGKQWEFTYDLGCKEEGRINCMQTRPVPVRRKGVKRDTGLEEMNDAFKSQKK
jgi:hypothetical protein